MTMKIDITVVMYWGWVVWICGGEGVGNDWVFHMLARMRMRMRLSGKVCSEGLR